MGFFWVVSIDSVNKINSMFELASFSSEPILVPRSYLEKLLLNFDFGSKINCTISKHALSFANSDWLWKLV